MPLVFQWSLSPSSQVSYMRYTLMPLSSMYRVMYLHFKLLWVPSTSFFLLLLACCVRVSSSYTFLRAFAWGWLAVSSLLFFVLHLERWPVSLLVDWGWHLSSFLHHCVVISNFADTNSLANAFVVFGVCNGLVHIVRRPTVAIPGSMTGRQWLFSSWNFWCGWQRSKWSLFRKRLHFAILHTPHTGCIWTTGTIFEGWGALVFQHQSCIKSHTEQEPSDPEVWYQK